MKIKKILVVALLLLFSTTFFACQEQQKPVLTWKESAIELNVDDVVQLKDLLTVKNGKFEDVEFTSLNTNVLVIQGRSIKVLSAGKALVEAKLNQVEEYLTVTAVSPQEKFSTPLNLAFDKNTNTISWDLTYKIVDLQPLYASSYILNITKDGQTSTQEVTTNSYTFEQAGDYQVSVVAKANNFANSNASQNVSFKILNAPTNLSFDKQTQTLSWQGGDYSFIVKVNNLQLPQTNNKSLQLDLNQVGEYKLSVIATKDEYYSFESQVLTITKLSSPTLSVQDGVLTFTRLQDNLVSNYKISVQTMLGEQTLIDNTDGTYTLQNVTNGDYIVKVKAIGTENSLDSEYSNDLTITKLSIPTIQFNAQTKVVTSSNENAKLFIKNTITNQIKSVDFENSSYTFNENVGIYELYAITATTQDNQIISDPSSSLFIKNLSSITNLRHESSNNISTLYFNNAEGCEGYRVYLDGAIVEGTLNTSQGYKIELNETTNTLFNSGTKQISIVGYDYTFELNGSNYYVLSENAVSEVISVTRFNTLTPTVDNKVISWESINNVVYYEYQLYKNGQLYTTGTEQTNSFDFSTLDFGNYTFKVKAIGDSANYLSSMEFGCVDFSVKQTLSAPTVTFNHENNSLIVGSVENADNYVIEHNSEVLATLTTDLSYDISSLLTLVQTYQFSVYAQSLTDNAETGGNLYNSSKTSIEIAKLEQLEEISISKNEKLTIDTSQINSKLDSQKYEIYINNSIVTDLQNYVFDGNSFEIKVKLISNKNSISPYYIDSEVSSFTLNRILTPTNLVFENYVISWSEVENASNYVCVFSNDDDNFEFSTITNSTDLKNTTYLDRVNSTSTGWDIKIIAKVENQIVQKNKTGYLNSSYSSDLKVNKLQSPILIDFESQDENDYEVKIDWNDVDNASGYLINSQLPSILSEIIVSDLTTVKNYGYSIIAVNPQYLNSEPLQVTLYRLNSVNSVNVYQDETFDFTVNNQTVSAIKINGTVQTLPYDISQVTTDKQLITIQLIGLRQENNFYMSSAVSSFAFKRLEKMNAPTLTNQIFTFPIVTDCDYYELVFNDGSQDFTLKINSKVQNQYVNSIDINDYPKLKEFLTLSGNYTVKIRACVNEYKHDKGENNIGLLTSEYSNVYDFEKLDKALNVSVQAENTIEQKLVTISWENVTGAQNYTVYLNNILFTTTAENHIQTDKLTFTGDYTTNGEYKIQVVANADGKLSSDMSDQVEVKRLSKVDSKNMKVSQQGILSWASILDTTNYATYITYSDYTSTKTQVSAQSYSYDEYLHSQEYCGYVTFFVCAVGDGTRVLTGEYQSVSVLKLDAPSIEITGEYLVINTSTLDSSAQFEVTVKFKDSNGIETLLDKFTTTANKQYVYPESWNNTEVLTDENGTFVFSVTTVKQNCINSNTLTKEISRVKSASFQGFIKNSKHGDTQLVVKINQVLDNANYYLEVTSQGKTFTINNIGINQNDQLVYPLTGQLATNLKSGSFTVKFYISANGYLNSNKIVLSGQKLADISNLSVENGQLRWNKSTDSNCQGYVLKVTNAVDTYHHDLDVNTLTDSLQGYVDSLVVNIKCLGNVTEQGYVLENVVLDSNYMSKLEQADLILTEQSLNVTKLAKPTNLSVFEGEFKILNPENSEFLKAKTNNVIYSLTGDFDDTGYFIGTSDDIYWGNNKLAVDTLHLFSFQACSNQNNVIYSDFSDDISIKILPNSVLSNKDISFSWSADNVDKYQISWKQSNLFNNYKVKLTNSIVTDKITYVTYFIKTNTNKILIDCNQMESGSYDAQVKVLGSSSLESGGFYYLSSIYSDLNRFTKLSQTNVYVEDGIIKWDAVNNADRYYVYYMLKTSDNQIDMQTYLDNSTMYSNMLTTNYWDVPDTLSSLIENNYYYFGVRAVSSGNPDYAPSKISGLGSFTNVAGEGEVFEFTPIAKLKAPDAISIQNGSLVWNNLDYDYTINGSDIVLNGGINPFVYTNNLNDLIVTLKFVNSDDNVVKFNLNPTLLFNADITQSQGYELIAEKLGLEKYFGWPRLGWLADEIGQIEPGEHSLSIMQRGNNNNWLNSMYNSSKNIYIPHATKIRINDFVLSWDEVNLKNSVNLNTTYKYSVVTEDVLGVRRLVYQTNDLSVDLRDLVNSDLILAGDYKIFVFVNGDNDYYLNGIKSNILDIKVLPAVVAAMQGGVLVWDSVSQTHTYKVTSVTGNVNYDYEFETTQTSWEMEELHCYDNTNQRLTYNIQVQCIGNGTTTISGKVANIGNVIKLIAPTLNVVKGRFEWANIEGNEGYIIYVTTQEGEVKTFNLAKDIVVYESSTQGFNNYNIRAVGTTESNLDSTSTSYAISDRMANGVEAVMLDAVTNAGVYNGNLLWLALKDLNDVNVTGYRLSFDDINYYEPVYFESYNINYIDGEQYIIFEVDEDFIAGAYEIYIQAYSNNTYYRVNDGKNYYQLFGPLQQTSSIEFIKLRQVSNIKTENGVVTWTSNDANSDNYLLHFTKDSESYIFNTTGISWDPSLLSDEELALYKQITINNSYELKIRVLGDNQSLVNSDYSEKVVYNKLQTISSVEYIQGNNEGFIIRFKFTDHISGITNYEYVIKYDNGSGESIINSQTSNLIRKGYNADEDYFYGEIDGSALLGQSSQSLRYQVCVVPVSQANTLISDYSQARTVYPPQSLSGEFQYNEQKRSISWIYASSGSDVKFRIVDELIELNELNEITVLSTKTYLSQSTEYILEDIGIHRISICVVLTGESVASSYVYFDYPVGMEGLIKDESFTLETPSGTCLFTLINFDLFEGGNGASDNPYIIATPEQFENLNQRLVKPSYLGGENLWTFVLNNNLNLTNANTIEQFGGIFDGNNHVITYSVSNTTNTRLGLFSYLTSNGVVKNLSVVASINQQNYSSISELYLAPFVVENYGNIYNCTLTSFNYTSQLEKSINIYFGGIATFNYGTIERCINNANVVFDGNANQAGVRASNINLGMIAYTNGKLNSTVLIKESGNNGNLTVYARSVAIGGITAIHNNGAIIQNCYSKGYMDILITQAGSNANYVGGLVASSQEIIKNSYSLTQITVDMNNLSRALYLGGLVGYISNTNGAVINNCYVGITSIQALNNAYSSTSVGMLVGYSNAQDTQSQIRSFYLACSVPAIIGAPNGFTYESYTNNANLLSLLNSQDYAYKANGSGAPKLIWEI